MIKSGRREFLQSLAAVAVHRSEQVPWSSGVGSPKRKSPANAADCHHHIYDSRFPMDVRATLHPGDATVEDYRLLQKRLGVRRHVVVQPSTYGVDNRCLVDALRQFGKSTARGIAVVNTEVSDASLKEMDDAGVCGIRFNLMQAGATTLDMAEPLAKRIAGMGWHVQVNASADQIMERIAVWKRLPVPVVFDHLGHVASAEDASFRAIAELLQSGKCWMKLSGAYMDTKVGAPTYSDRSLVAKAYVGAAPERLIWGTDWPHPTTEDKPDDAMLLDLLGEWCPAPALRRRILVENPIALYGFSG